MTLSPDRFSIRDHIECPTKRDEEIQSSTYSLVDAHTARGAGDCGKVVETLVSGLEMLAMMLVLGVVGAIL